MQIRFLLHDHEEATHNDLVWEFDEQVTLRQLKDIISSKWNIPQEMLNIFLVDGRNTNYFDLNSQLPQIGLRNLDKLIVRHSMAANWKKFVANFELARQALALKRIGDVKEAVDQALDNLRPLVKAKFLVIFPNYGEIYRQFKANFSRYMDQEFKCIELAVQDYFSKVFADNAECLTLDIRCEKKGFEEGGLICQVLRRETLIGKYYVKEHMGLANWQHADLREIFYKLFELIQVGPKVHFIPNTLFLFRTLHRN